MESIYIKDDFIKLGQALKLAGAVESGLDAKICINDGLVIVNGETVTQRGKKLVEGDQIIFDNQEYVIVKRD